MANISGVDRIIVELRTEKTHLTNQLRHVDAALSVLGKLNGKIVPISAPAATAGIGHRMSVAARRKISLAQKARWARVKAGKK